MDSNSLGPPHDARGERIGEAACGARDNWAGPVRCAVTSERHQLVSDNRDLLVAEYGAQVMQEGVAAFVAPEGVDLVADGGVARLRRPRQIAGVVIRADELQLESADAHNEVRPGPLHLWRPALIGRIPMPGLCGLAGSS